MQSKEKQENQALNPKNNKVETKRAKLHLASDFMLHVHIICTRKEHPRKKALD
jgi:hypothetical protein